MHDISKIRLGEWIEREINREIAHGFLIDGHMERGRERNEYIFTCYNLQFKREYPLYEEPLARCTCVGDNQVLDKNIQLMSMDDESKCVGEMVVSIRPKAHYEKESRLDKLMSFKSSDADKFGTDLEAPSERETFGYTYSCVAIKKPVEFDWEQITPCPVKISVPSVDRNKKGKRSGDEIGTGRRDGGVGARGKFGSSLLSESEERERYITMFGMELVEDEEMKHFRRKCNLVSRSACVCVCWGGGYVCICSYGCVSYLYVWVCVYLRMRVRVCGCV
mgnify:CR=1 FL=1